MTGVQTCALPIYNMTKIAAVPLGGTKYKDVMKDGATGTYYYKIRVTLDENDIIRPGEFSEIASVTITADAENPVITEFQLPNNEHNMLNKQGKINVKLSDNAGISNARVEISPAGTNNWSTILEKNEIAEFDFDLSETELADGEYDIKLTAQDYAGNEVVQTKNIVLDTNAPAPPVFTIEGKTGGVKLNITSHESDIDKYTVFYKKSEAVDWQQRILAAGVTQCFIQLASEVGILHDFKLTAFDKAGNQSEFSETSSIAPSAFAPEISIDKDPVYIGDSMLITAAGFLPSEQVSLYFNGNYASDTHADSEGEAKFTYRPSVDDAGVYQLKVQGYTSHAFVIKNINLQALNAELLVPQTAVAGDKINISVSDLGVVTPHTYESAEIYLNDVKLPETFSFNNLQNEPVRFNASVEINIPYHIFGRAELRVKRIYGNPYSVSAPIDITRNVPLVSITPAGQHGGQKVNVKVKGFKNV